MPAATDRPAGCTTIGVTSATGTGRLIELVRTVGPELELSEAFERLLTERIARAAAAWPALRLDDQQFVRVIVERLPREAPVAALDAMRTDDLYLVCGCIAGDRAALAGFEARCGPVIAQAIAATGASMADRADLGQIVRQRLLVAPASGRAPRIATYSGRGSLGTWVRVVATREALRLLPRRARDVGAPDNALASRIATADDPEVKYLKRLYRHEFKQAFQVALDALGDRERQLLRQHAIDGLSVDQLARLHGVHRATAARWVQSARDAVLAGTHRELIRRLRLTRHELASIMRLIQSQLDVSLLQVLQRSA